MCFLFMFNSVHVCCKKKKSNGLGSKSLSSHLDHDSSYLSMAVIKHHDRKQLSRRVSFAFRVQKDRRP